MENHPAAKVGLMKLIDKPTRYLFFTGKGGVGKTSTACALAIKLADRGRKVLIVSTDPASNLDDVLGKELSSRPTAIDFVRGLFALNIDPEAAASDYRDRVVGPYRGVLPADVVSSMEEQLSGACTVEVAAFDEFTAFLAEDGEAADFDHVVFDTAPTGHTLRLLQLPAAWTDFMETNERGASCLGPASGLKTQQDRYRAAVEALVDEHKTTLVLVARPESGAVGEAERTSMELESIGLKNQHLIVNGVFQATDRTDQLALALEQRGRKILASLPARLSRLTRTEISLKGHNLVGVNALREMYSETNAISEASHGERTDMPDLPSLSAIVDEIAAKGNGLVMLMGKGGVGKTSIAAAIAVELAARGLPVHLTTTDPAAHLLNALPDEIEGLRVSRIDPASETEDYRQKVIRSSGKNLDADGLALLEEDLRSPCTEEVAVFHAFSRIVAGARREIVVMDTAPTGHTLLLLDATGAYHKEVMRSSHDGGINMVTPLMRLRDADYTKVLIVTLPETTPVNEAAQLQDDLKRAGIESFAWVINASLSAAVPTDPLLVRRAEAEIPLIRKVRDELAKRIAVVPLLAEEPTGSEALRKIVRRQANAAV